MSLCRVLIILTLEKVGFHEGTIGNPTAYDTGAAGTKEVANASAAHQPNMQPQPNAGYPPQGVGYGQPPPAAYGAFSSGGTGAAHGVYGGQSNFQTGPVAPAGGSSYMGGPAYGAPPSHGAGGGAGIAQGPSSRNVAHVPPPQYGGSGAVVRNEAPARIVPIKALNPFTGRWTIKARCTIKQELKRRGGTLGDVNA